jgi:hypothetical protein
MVLQSNTAFNTPKMVRSSHPKGGDAGKSAHLHFRRRIHGLGDAATT